MKWVWEKTLIARGAIVKTARLRIEEKDDLFKVIYICSNQNIANQNIRKLDVTGKNAIGSVSDTRLSMQHLKISEQENDPQIKEGYIHAYPPYTGNIFPHDLRRRKCAGKSTYICHFKENAGL